MSFGLAASLLGVYALFMLALAQWVERRPDIGRRVSASPLVYTLTLAIYMSGWTYFGSVGQAANNGPVFMTTYLGPTLCMLFWPMITGRILRLKKSARITSIADFLGNRYGRSHLVAGMAAAMALLGSLPYVALQMKAVLSSLSILAGIDGGGSAFTGLAGPGMLLFMAAFIIVAGVRRIDPTERHQGVITVIAFESLVKLFGFLAVGFYVCFVLFEGPGDIFAKATAAGMGRLMTVGGQEADLQDWVGRILLFMPVILLLPRQFHVAVVENSRPDHLRSAVWMLPLYMLLMNVFVMPIALGGMLLGLPAGAGDTFVLLLPQMGGSAWLSFVVFLGGFSAAMSMIAISAMTNATMVSNDLFLPLASRFPSAEWARRNLLVLRWIVVCAYLGAGYIVNLAIGESTMLVSMGTMSMVAVAQFTPAAILGLFWKDGNKTGAVAGLGAGFAVWLYTLVLPGLARSGVLDASFLSGPFGLAWLAPESLLGLTALTPLNHTLFWSVILNSGAYVLCSLLVKPGLDEQEMTIRFFSDACGKEEARVTAGAPRSIPLSARTATLEGVFKTYLPERTARRFVRLCVERAGCSGLEKVSVVELAAVYAEAERILGGLIGAASAHKAVLDEKLYTAREREELSSIYGRVLADMNVPPEEMRRRVDYYQERETLLMENAQALTAANQALEEEVRVRRQFEMEARRAEEKYRSIFDNAVEGIFQTSLDGRILEANPAAARILGYDSPEELIRSVKDVGATLYVHAGDRERFIQGLRKDGIVSNFETIFNRLDGATVWVSMHARALKDDQGRISLIEGIIEDITERKMAEEQLRRATQTVRDIIDSMPSAMIAVSWEGKVVHCNREASARFGIDASEAEGKPLSGLVERLGWTLELVGQALDTGEPQFKGRVRDEGEQAARYFDVMAYPLSGSSEVVLRVDDVTERVRVEDMMVQTEKMFSLGGLAAGMAHEINNPLGAIVGSAQNMERRLEHGRTMNEEAAAQCGVTMEGVRCYLHSRGILDMIGAVRVSGLRAAEIVRNMLEFSRKSEGGTATADASTLLDKAVELASQDYDLKKRFDFKQIKIIREYAPGLPPVPCRPMEIEQVILNLLRNAAQAMMGGKQAGREPEIRLRTMLEGDMVRIEVADNGPGMDEATRKRVFEPFFTTKPVGIGTGLGLSVSYFIVTSNHSGQFSVESAPDKGATFIIRLPAGGVPA